MNLICFKKKCYKNITIVYPERFIEIALDNSEGAFVLVDDEDDDIDDDDDDWVFDVVDDARECYWVK